MSIAGVGNILADTLSRFPSKSVYRYETTTMKAQYCANELFTIDRYKKYEDYSLLDILNVQIEQQTDMINVNNKLMVYISDRGSGYYKEYLDNAKIICHDSKIYVPQSLCRCVTYWYHLYLNHTGGGILDKTTR